MDVKEEKYVSWADAKKILDKKAKDRELGYEQKNALEFLKKFSKLPEKKAAEMAEELGKLGKLKEKHIVMIVDMLPKEMEELRVLFANEIITLSEEERKKILAVVKKFS